MHKSKAGCSEIVREFHEGRQHKSNFIRWKEVNRLIFEHFIHSAGILANKMV